jgi:hypothetical protein
MNGAFMRLIPKDKVGKIQFCIGHLPAWAEHADQIGVAPEDVALLAGSTEEARLAYAEQQQAQQAAQAATLKLTIALEKMQTQASAILAMVRGKAAGAGPGVYSLAEIPAPEKPSPIAAPGTPTGFTVSLDAIGAVTLTWKCKNPRGSTGTTYHIWRQIDNGQFVYMGICGTKRYVDQTFPRGTASVTYQIQAMRSTTKGPIALFPVNFGTTGRRMGIRVKPVSMAA